jgi:hypothetical protein
MFALRIDRKWEVYTETQIGERKAPKTQEHQGEDRKAGYDSLFHGNSDLLLSIMPSVFPLEHMKGLQA